MGLKIIMDQAPGIQVVVTGSSSFALALFGGDTIRHFVIILLVGIFSGTYSSIFNASPILVVWENREWRTWFRRKTETETA